MFFLRALIDSGSLGFLLRELFVVGVRFFLREFFGLNNLGEAKVGVFLFGKVWLVVKWGVSGF